MTRRVLITGARAPVAAELAGLFNRIGAEVHVADSTPLLLAAGLKCVAGGHRLPPARDDVRAYGEAVAALVERLGIDLIVPTCEEIFFLAAARDAGHRVPLFASPLATLRSVHDKFAFIELASHAGIAVPQTRRLTSKEEVDELADRSRELVFKPCFSRFGTETRVGVAPNKLADVQPSAASPWIAQQRLHGEEVCAYAVALGGKLAVFSAYRPCHRMGRAASYFFEPVDLPEGERIAAAVIEATAFHGQISFDMIRTPERGLLPIECNPRATSGLHLLADQPELAARMLDGKPGCGVLRPAPDVQPAMISLAMWVSGLPRAALSGNVGRWRRDLARGRDVLSFPENPLTGRACKMFAAYFRESFATGRTMREFTTADIEWNGEPLDAGA
jgi:hypothetical protein